MVEAIEMAFELRTWMGPKKRIKLGSKSTMGKGNLKGEGAVRGKV